MKRLITQFDDTRLKATVATPTCSSCCCCCCCLATVATSSSLLAQKINREAKAKGTSDRPGLTLLAALFVPVICAIVYGLYKLINVLLNDCTTQTYPGDAYMSDYSYQVCRSPANGLLIPLFIGTTVFILWYLYMRVQIEHAFRRSVLVTVLIGITFAVEAFVGIELILHGGGVVYLVMVPLIACGITYWYNRHLREKFAVSPVAVANAWEDTSKFNTDIISDNNTSAAPKPPTETPEQHGS